MAKESDQTIVRVPSELIQKVRVLAQKKQSTIPRQIEYLLRKALENESRK